MVRKKHDLLRTGLSSELFFLAMLKPDTGSDLGRRLQGRKTPSMSKIYRNLNDLEFSKYLKKIDNVYHVNPKKLFLEIENQLKSKNQYFDDVEKKLIIKVLSGNFFLGIFSIRTIEELKRQPKGDHKIDALTIFFNYIGHFSSIVLFQCLHDPKIKKSNQILKKMSPNEVDEMFNELDTFEQEFSVKGKKLIDSEISKMPKQFILSMEQSTPAFFEIIDNMKYSIGKLSSMVPFYMMKESTLKKLSSLWDQSKGFELGVKMALKPQR
ncbi:hypothetical protein [Nitrosarchaeum sp.]|uniref:hypothetical protein n=1 Tax=Nitrosarchaeum sp. TaxID=2026886 RepID=UPI00247EF53D|nr:hypothetical protein [Nitrosarchaeum sp.]MCV0412393.1 hypothetical protein [Nitrosarchaeum sp.]